MSGTASTGAALLARLAVSDRALITESVAAGHNILVTGSWYDGRDDIAVELSRGLHGPAPVHYAHLREHPNEVSRSVFVAGPDPDVVLLDLLPRLLGQESSASIPCDLFPIVVHMPWREPLPVVIRSSELLSRQD